NTECDVELRRHRLAGLADLELVRVVAGVDGGAGGADGGTERVGEGLDDGEALRAADTTSTGDDDAGVRQLGTVAAFDGLAAEHLGGLGGVDGGQVHRDGLGGTVGGFGFQGAGAHGDDRGAVADLRVHGVGATEDRLGRGAITVDVDRVDQ